MRIASLTILCLALAAVPAFAQWTYENGIPDGTTDAWTINFGFVVSDTFVSIFGGYAQAGSIYVWAFPGDQVLSVDFTISTSENGPGIGGTANVKQTFISSNQFGYDIDRLDFNIGNIGQLDGNTAYWLNIFNAVVANGDPVFWDENSGAGCRSRGCPSLASENSVGTIPSEAFTIFGSESCGGCTTPEPSSILLFGSGILGLVGVLRCKLL